MIPVDVGQEIVPLRNGYPSGTRLWRGQASWRGEGPQTILEGRTKRSTRLAWSEPGRKVRSGVTLAERRPPDRRVWLGVAPIEYGSIPPRHNSRVK